MRLYKEFYIEAAHRLPNLPEGHKCHRLHGHSFKVIIHIDGDLGMNSGWVMDFAEISEKFRPVFDALDHRYLNEVDGLENPTSENLAVWIWDKLQPELPQLCAVEIKETCTSGCFYTK